MNQPTTPQTWRERFIEKFTAYGYIHGEVSDLESFIQQIIEQEVKKERERIANEYSDCTYPLKDKEGRTIRWYLLPHYKHKEGDDGS